MIQTSGTAMGPGRGSREGFTLIEILLAIGILAFGISTVLFLFSMGVRSHSRARDRTQAALLAEAVANQIQAELVEGMQGGGGDPPPILNAAHPDFPEFTYDVRFTPHYQGYFYQLEIVVRWSGEDAEATEQSSETFMTLVRCKSF